MGYFQRGSRLECTMSIILAIFIVRVAQSRGAASGLAQHLEVTGAQSWPREVREPKIDGSPSNKSVKGKAPDYKGRIHVLRRPTANKIHRMKTFAHDVPLGPKTARRKGNFVGSAPVPLMAPQPRGRGHVSVNGASTFPGRESVPVNGVLEARGGASIENAVNFGDSTGAPIYDSEFPGQGPAPKIQVPSLPGHRSVSVVTEVSSRPWHQTAPFIIEVSVRPAHRSAPDGRVLSLPGSRTAPNVDIPDPVKAGDANSGEMIRDPEEETEAPNVEEDTEISYVKEYPKIPDAEEDKNTPNVAVVKTTLGDYVGGATALPDSESQGPKGPSQGLGLENELMTNLKPVPQVKHHGGQGEWKALVDLNSPLGIFHPVEAIARRRYLLEKSERDLLEQMLWSERVMARRQMIAG